MARPLRLSFENAFYHITARGHRKEKIFCDDKDKKSFIRKLNEALLKYTITCYAYCLMDNHYHLFIKTAQPNISQAIHYLNASYANWFRTRYQLTGSIFQGRFKSILVDADSYALVLSAYIHLNPLRAGIVNKLEEFTWSSYLDYLRLRKPQIANLDSSLVLHFFTSDSISSIKQYQEYIWQNQMMEDPLTQSYRHIALGSDNFIEEIKLKIEKKGQTREIPITHSVPFYHVEQIFDNMCKALQIEKAKILSEERGNIYRPLALYLIKHFTSLKLSQIGQLFDMDYSAVSQAVKRFEQKYKKNNEIAELKQKMINVLKKRLNVKC